MPWTRHPRSEWEEHREWLYGAGGPFRWQIGGGRRDPQPTGIFSAVPEAVAVPVVIGEVPETWEELAELEPDLFEPILETRPGKIPDPYPQSPDEGFVNPSAVIGAPDDWWPTETQEESEEEDMAHDWGHVAREFISGYAGGGPPQTGYVAPPILPGTDVTAGPGFLHEGGHNGGNGDGCDGMTWSGGAPPKGYKVVNACGVGVLRKVRRRRRRRLLSASDSRDIATIVGLVGKGQMAASLINRR